MIIDSHVHVFPKISGMHNGCKLESAEYGKWVVHASQEKFEEFRQECIFEGDTSLSNPRNYGRIRNNEFWVRICSPSINFAFSSELYSEYMDTYGIDKAVILQAPAYYLPDLNDYISNTVKKWPQRFLGAAQLDPLEKEAVPKLEHAVNVLGLRALKLELTSVSGWMQFHPELRLNDEKMAPLWGKASQLRIPVVFDIGSPGSPSYQINEIKWILDNFSDLRLVIAHLAGGRERRSNLPSWKDAIFELGKYSNVWFSSEPVKQDDLDCLQTVCETVGAEKIMWGTDYPWWSKLYNYNELIENIKDCGFLSDGERRAVMGETAARVFDFR